jgi:hypothetical protein
MDIHVLKKYINMTFCLHQPHLFSITRALDYGGTRIYCMWKQCWWVIGTYIKIQKDISGERDIHNNFAITALSMTARSQCWTGLAIVYLDMCKAVASMAYLPFETFLVRRSGFCITWIHCLFNEQRSMPPPLWWCR